MEFSLGLTGRFCRPKLGQLVDITDDDDEAMEDEMVIAVSEAGTIKRMGSSFAGNRDIQASWTEVRGLAFAALV